MKTTATLTVYELDDKSAFKDSYPTLELTRDTANYPSRICICVDGKTTAGVDAHDLAWALRKLMTE